MKTGRLQKKIAEILILLTIIHTVLLGTYFGFVIVGNIKKEVQNTIDAKNAQISTQVDHVNELVSHYSTAFLENENVHEIIGNCDFAKNSYDTSIASKELDSFFASLFSNSYDAKGCMVFPKKGEPYVFYNFFDEIIFPKDDLEEIKKSLSSTSGEIVWLGKHTFKTLYNEEEDYFIVGRTLRNLNDDMSISLEKIADIAYIFKMKDLTSFNINSRDNKEIMIVLNPKKQVAYSSLDNEMTSGVISELISLDNSLETEFLTINYKSLSIFAKVSTTSLTGWYVIAGNGDFHIGNEIFKAIGIMVCIFLAGIFFVNILFNIEIKKLFRPIKDITEAMEKIGKKDFNIHLEAENAGELGVNMFNVVFYPLPSVQKSMNVDNIEEYTKYAKDANIYTWQSWVNIFYGSAEDRITDTGEFSQATWFTNFVTGKTPINDKTWQEYKDAAVKQGKFDKERAIKERIYKQEYPKIEAIIKNLK